MPPDFHSPLNCSVTDDLNEPPLCLASHSLGVKPHHMRQHRRHLPTPCLHGAILVPIILRAVGDCLYYSGSGHTPLREDS
jgi:hypothetical protein